MSHVLLITVRLHDGDHGTGDEPPSPAALPGPRSRCWLGGATGFAAVRWAEWLEDRVPPVIASPLMTNGQAVKNYVPNNDLDAVGGDPRRLGEILHSRLSGLRVFGADIPLMYAWEFDDDDKSNLQVTAICALVIPSLSVRRVDRHGHGRGARR